MCGIVASCSVSNALENILLGLKRLEYRGYDSAGVAFLDENGNIKCNKCKGRVLDLKTKFNLETQQSSVAIGHTRWATHGVPSDANAHPHFNHEVAIVHNGIIENYYLLKEDLIANGYTFESQTDSEVVTALLYNFLKKGLSKFDALSQLFGIINGTFAIAAIFKGDSKIYAIKRGSPMVVGHFNDGNFIASDVYAIAGFVSHITYIDDDEIVILDERKIDIFRKDGKKIKKAREEIKIKSSDVDKGSYPHYMLKEIYEQSGSIRNNILAHYDSILNEIVFPFCTEDLSHLKFIKIVACGSSYNAGLIAKHWFKKYTGLEVFCEIASEFRYNHNNLDLEDVLYIFISQSGETADTISAIKYVKQNKIKSSKTLAIVNVSQSQIAKIADYKIECLSGPEIGVAATKSFTSQLLSLAFLVLKIASDKSLITKETLQEIVSREIQIIPNKIDEFLNNKKILENIDTLCNVLSSKIKKNHKLIYVGKGIFYGICIEAALKAQELFYIPILAFTSGELKHGPIAILDKKTCVLALANTEYLYNKISSSIEEISARSAQVFLIANLKHEKTNYFIDTSMFGDFHEISSPILYSVPMHLMSYKISILLGNDVDKPRGLAKSVTVE